MRDPQEPQWLRFCEIEAIHRELITATGGSPGMRDRGLVESALAAVQATWFYAQEPPSLVILAARLAYGLVKNHGFVDGNKRTAFLATYTFLALNGVLLAAPQQAVVQAMETLAEARVEPEIAQADFALWLSDVTTPIGDRNNG